MKNRNYIPVSIVLGLIYWVGESFVHWLGYGEEAFEVIPSDTNELCMRTLIFILLVCFGIYANHHTKKIIAKEEEKRKIFMATTGASQHILNNFLNEMLYFEDEAVRVGGFDDKTLEVLNEAIRNARDQLDALSKVSDISDENIRLFVHPDSDYQI